MMRTMTTMTMAVALASCGAPAKQAPIENTGGGEALAPTPAAGAGFRDGALWSCQISDYDPQPCKLEQQDGGWRLTKLLGSQRFDGRLQRAGAALAFDGEFFCPWGDCTTAMQVSFEPTGNTTYVAQFADTPIALVYDDGLASEYGAAGYGGLNGHEQ